MEMYIPAALPLFEIIVSNPLGFLVEKDWWYGVMFVFLLHSQTEYIWGQNFKTFHTAI